MDKVDPKVALELAKETLRHAATADWHAEKQFMLEARGSELTISQVHEKLGTVTGRAFNVAVQVLMDNALHAPTASERRRSSEVLVKLHLAELELKCKYLQAYLGAADGGNAVEQPGPMTGSVTLPSLPELPPMTQEQLTELIQARRQRRNG